MNRNHLIKALRKIIAAMGIWTKQELKERIPELYKAYENVYGSKRPDIKIQVSDVFSFPMEKYSRGSWNEIFLWRSGQVEAVSQASKYYGTQHKLSPNDMVLDCMTGNLNVCYLYIHPDNANKLLPQADITDDEKIVLKNFYGLKPFARKEGFYEKKYGYREVHDAMRKHPEEYENILQELAKKGLVKISSSGATTLTKEGKNIAVR